jgi:signal transduction histidine kinase
VYDNFFKRTYLLSSIALCLIFSLQGLAQNKKAIDSLLNVIDSNSEKKQISAIINLSLEYYDFDNNKALDLIEKAFKLAVEHGDSASMVRAGRIEGQLLRRLDKVEESIEVLNEVVNIAERNDFKEEYKRILNALAIAYTFNADYDNALKYNFKSLLLRETSGDQAQISISLNNIGLVYFYLNNFDKAIEFYRKALKLKKEVNDNYDLDRLLINLGMCYNQIKDYKSAREYINEGFKICGENCNVQIKIEGEFGLGVSYYNSELDYEQARFHILKSYQIAKELGDKRWQIENIIFLSRISSKLKEDSVAKDFLTKAELIASGTEYNYLLIEIYKAFFILYNDAKDFEKSSFYQNKYINLKDSIYDESLIKNIAKIQTDYEERENKAIIATKEEVIQRQRSLNIAIGIISVLACLLIFVLYQSNKVKKRVNQALSDAKNFIELKNIELDKKVAEKTADLEVANDSLSKVNEELDNFIYKTSHDIRGPLASLKGICNVALMDVKDPVAVSYLEKLDITAENLNTILTRLLIINQINNSSVKPEPINFDFIIEEVMLLEKKRGLPPRLQVKKYIQEGVEFYCDKEFIRIILENLIDNAIKFYNDSDRVEPFVEVRIEEENREMKIRVIDNGIGISEAKPDKIFQMFSRASERSSTGGIGLYITKTACEKIGGQVGLRTTPEGYTEFYVKFVMDTIIAPAEFEA